MMRFWAKTLEVSYISPQASINKTEDMKSDKTHSDRALKRKIFYECHFFVFFVVIHFFQAHVCKQTIHTAVKTKPGLETASCEIQGHRICLQCPFSEPFLSVSGQR